MNIKYTIFKYVKWIGIKWKCVNEPNPCVLVIIMMS